MGNLFLPNVLTDIHYNPSISLPAAKHSAAPYPFSFIQAVNSSLPIGEVQLFDTPRCVGTCAQQVYTKVFKTAAGNAIIAMMGTVPGYWVTIWLVDFMGRVAIQTLGFVMSTLLLIILAAGYTQIVKASYWIFIVLYAFTFFFMNFGPNATTFLTPVELFETKYRSTLHGFSAATGKAGAIVGAFAIGKAFLEGGMSLQATLGILAATNLLGLVCTAFVPEAKRLSLQDANKTQSLFGKLVHRCTGTWQVVEPRGL
ncbi:hypothetical protein WJX77_004659 [Trebouxia sp. C0004]